jgi:FtsP/CotA-like multicopper oxidase with cupredoxin domain
MREAAMTMTTNLRRAALSIAAGGGLAVLGVLAGPAGPANAAEHTIELYAASGTTTLPGTTPVTVPVWGYYCTQVQVPVDPPTDPPTTTPDPSCPAGSPTSVGAPGGPTLRVKAGDTVTIRLHNDLPQPDPAKQENTTLFIGGATDTNGQPLAPDTTGATPGGTATYTFKAGTPGTYLYQAGVIGGGGAHQAAMGLYGALVVEPATAGQAYDAATAFDRESVMVLSELDPALNNFKVSVPDPADPTQTVKVLDPSAFDLRKFSPRWTLINGKAHPDTATIAASSGQNLLLRWVNAGTNYHSMGVLGADQRLVAVDGKRLVNPSGTDLSRHYVAETFGPGQTADAIVALPATADDRRLAVYDAGFNLHNGPKAPGLGGMLTSVVVAGTTSTTDSDAAGPATSNVAWEGGHLTATVSSANTGAAVITGAQYVVDSITGTPVAMDATDAAFDSATEDVKLGTTADAALATQLAVGQHIVYVRGQVGGSWGPYSSVLVNGSDNQGPSTSAVVLDPDRTTGAVDVAVTATADDSASGGSTIAGGELTLDGGGAVIPLTTVTDGVSAALEGTIPAARLAGPGYVEGIHRLSIRSLDSPGNAGDPVVAILVIDRTAPGATEVSVDPNVSNGTVPVNGSSPSVRLSATLTDPTMTESAPPADQSAIVAPGEVTAAQARIDAGGSTIPMEVADGAWGGAIEGVYLDIPLTTVKTLSDGTHDLFVRGRDAAGNWGEWQSTVLTVDRTGPAVGALTLTPNPTNGAATVTLTGTVDLNDPSGVDRVEYFVGKDPGVGQGTAISPASDGTFMVVVDLTPYDEGDYTVTVRAIDNLGNRASAASQLHLVPALWFSTSGNTNPPGLTNGDDADIYNWTGTHFGRTVDASANPYNLPANGGGNANVDGFSRVDGTHFYVSFTGQVYVDGLGNVQDEDVVFWNSNHWEMFFDGSANGNGLGGTTNSTSFDLDAISVVGGQLYFSTDNGNLPSGAGGSGDDADIYRWNPGQTPRYTRVIDASGAGSIGLPSSANVDGFVWRSTTDWYMSFAGTTTTVTGLGSVQDEDVVERNAGVWSVYFDGTSRGLTNNNEDVDAFDIP